MDLPEKPPFYAYMHDSNNLVDLFKLMTKGGGYVHRGDINYNGGYIGLPLGSDADIMNP